MTTRKCDAFNCTNKVNPCKPKPLPAGQRGGVRGGLAAALLGGDAE